MVWEAALPGPRIVNIRQRGLKKTIRDWELEHAARWPPPCVEDTVAEEPDITGTDVPGFGDDERPVQVIDQRDLRSQSARTALGLALGAYEHDEEGYKDARLLGIECQCPPPHIIFCMP